MASNKCVFHINAALYASPAVAIAFAGLPLYIHAPDYYATSFGISLASLGFILLILRAVDALVDPLIGALSDRYVTLRQWILVGGGILLAGGFWSVFNPPHHLQDSKTLPLVWFFFSVLVCTTGFSVVSINYLAISSMWKGTDHQRTLTSTWRESFGLIGLLTASILPSAFGLAVDSASAYRDLSIAGVLISLSAGILLMVWWRRTRLERPEVHSGDDVSMMSFGEIVSPLRISWARSFFAVYALSAFASSVPAVLVIYFVRDYLGLYDHFGNALALYFLSGAISMPFWSIVSKRFSKVATWRLGMVVAALTFIWAFFLPPGGLTGYLVICVLSGAALGADLSLPPSILADRIAAAGEEKIASRYFAILTFLNKGTLALATGLALPLVDIFGLEPGRTTSSEAAMALAVTYALVPSLLKLIAAFAGRAIIPSGNSINLRSV